MAPKLPYLTVCRDALIYKFINFRFIITIIIIIILIITIISSLHKYADYEYKYKYKCILTNHLRVSHYFFRTKLTTPTISEPVVILCQLRLIVAIS